MNKRYFSFISIFFTFFICCLLISCGSDSDNDGVNDDIDLEPKTPLNAKVDSKGREIKEKQIGNIHFYIETSASMGGYFKNDAEFKTIISDLTAKIDKNIKPIDIWFTADSTFKYNGSTQQFFSDIATTKIANQNSSQLHNIIANIVDKNKSNDVTILVSDCILSFPDSDIKKNIEINKTEAPNALKNNIFSTFSDLKKKGLATSVYAFNSKFYGTYYDYQNGKHLLNGDKRPFYIWVIGDKGILGKFNSSLSEISTFKPENSLHFGLTEKPITKYDIIPQIDRKGLWNKNNNDIEGIELKQDNNIQFSVGVNLDNLPSYAKEIQYIKNNINIDANGCEITFDVKNKDNVDRSKLKSEQQIKLLENSSHIILFTVNSMDLRVANFRVSLPLQYDNWYMDWSTMDDKITANLNKKTFALEYLINGVTEAYSSKNKKFIEFQINLNKK